MYIVKIYNKDKQKTTKDLANKVYSPHISAAGYVTSVMITQPAHIIQPKSGGQGEAFMYGVRIWRHTCKLTDQILHLKVNACAMRCVTNKR